MGISKKKLMSWWSIGWFWTIASIQFFGVLQSCKTGHNLTPPSPLLSPLLIITDPITILGLDLEFWAILQCFGALQNCRTAELETLNPILVWGISWTIGSIFRFDDPSADLWWFDHPVLRYAAELQNFLDEMTWFFFVVFLCFYDYFVHTAVRCVYFGITYTCWPK